MVSDTFFCTLDIRYTFAKQGTDLVFNNTLTIKNFDFATGALGIHLAEASDTSTPAIPIIEFGNNGFPTEEKMPPEEFGAWVTQDFGEVNYIVRGRQGIYLFQTDLGDDQLYGGPRGDQLVAAMGNDQLFGENGDDELDGGLGGDLDALFGQEGSDVFAGGQGVVTFALTQ